MIKNLFSTVIVAVAALSLMACDPPQQTTQDKNEQTRNDLMDRAINAVPAPQINNFLAREAVSELMTRLDQPEKTFYVYILADTGNIIGYFVSSTYPISYCQSLTPPDKAERVAVPGTPDPAIVRKAPTLDGTYSGGGGSCSTYFFFDAETDALIMMRDQKTLVFDAPLKLETEPVRFQPAVPKSEQDSGS